MHLSENSKKFSPYLERMKEHPPGAFSFPKNIPLPFKCIK